MAAIRETNQRYKIDSIAHVSGSNNAADAKTENVKSLQLSVPMKRKNYEGQATQWVNRRNGNAASRESLPDKKMTCVQVLQTTTSAYCNIDPPEKRTHFELIRLNSNSQVIRNDQWARGMKREIGQSNISNG